MATASYLNAPVNRAAEVFFVSSIAGAVVGGYIRVDDEFAIITELAGQAVTVRSRGSFGGAACAHPARAPVTFGKLKDMLVNPPATDTPQTASGASYRQRSRDIGGPLDLSEIAENTEYQLTATGPLMVTLNVPARFEQEGLRVRFTADNSVAHRIENPFLTDQPTIVNLPARLGANVEYQAVRGFWVPVSQFPGLTSEWTIVPYDAANFAADNGIWTVAADKVLDYSYFMFSRTTMFLSVSVSESTITAGTTVAKVRVPNQRLIARHQIGAIGRIFNGLTTPVADMREYGGIVSTNVSRPDYIEIRPVKYPTEKVVTFSDDRLHLAFQMAVELVP